MPRLAKATATETEGESRRSTRIKAIEAAKPVAAAPKKKAPAKPRAQKEKADNAVEKAPAKKSRKRAVDADDEEAKSEEPAAKKAKSEKKPAEEDPTDDFKPLEIGDILPDIALKNEKGEDVSVKDLAKETGVVLFLFPKADTPGCTKQACGFRDVYDEFPANGYTVYGLSGDSGAATTKWQTKKNLQFSFLSDPSRELVKALGALSGKSTKRSHFIFEKGGKLVDKKIPVKPEDSPTKALAFIKSHNKA
ncbi:AhpC-TSA-domain-containing protein [Auriculariales sp. MPI-PUGE-AT-0066]|nr:AhpC-TSA-domain-containing protein [Auriculariales sp. MPI-PUGE-AT-0066]